MQSSAWTGPLQKDKALAATTNAPNADRGVAAVLATIRLLAPVASKAAYAAQSADRDAASGGKLRYGDAEGKYGLTSGKIFA